MPWTAKQLEVFRIRMHDKKLSAKERDKYRKLFAEGKRKPIRRAVRKRGNK